MSAPDAVGWCASVMRLIDDYVERPDASRRHAIRSALMDRAALAQPATVAQLVAAELERIADEAPISGNELAQVRVLMAAARLRGAA